MTEQQPWFYLSFAGTDGFLGGVYAQARSDMEAYFAVTHARLNPGGEIMIVRLPKGVEPPEELRGRLLTKEEVLAS